MTKKKGRRRRRGSGMGPAPQGGGAETEERFPNSGKPPIHWGNPLSDGEIDWDRREASEAVRRCWSSRSVADGDRVRNTQSVPGPYVSQLGCVFTGVQAGWELVHGDWRTGPEWELLLAVGRQTEGMGGRKATTGNAYGGRQDSHGSRALLLSHMQGEEPLL